MALQVWDAKTGTLLRTQQGHKGAITCLAYSSTCKLLFSASIDNTVGIWTDKGANLQASLPRCGLVLACSCACAVPYAPIMRMPCRCAYGSSWCSG